MNLSMRVKKGICTIAAVAMAGGAAFAASPAQVYEEAARNMLANPQGEYVVQVKMDMPLLGKASFVNTIDMQAEPFQVKSEAVATVLNKTQTVRSYAEQDGDVMHVYYEKTKDGQTTWKKADRKLKSAAPISEKFHKDHNVLNGVKSVKKGADNVYTVTYDVSRLYNEADKSKWQKDGYKKAQAEGFAKVLKALQKSGDIKALVTIDPKTKRITNVSLPLTPQIRAAVLSVLQDSDIPEANKAVMEQFIQYSEISMSVDWKELPEGIELTAPQTVKDKATFGQDVPGTENKDEAA